MMIFLAWMAHGKPMVCLWDDIDMAEPFSEGRYAASMEEAKEYIKDPASAEGMVIYNMPSDEPYPYHRVREAIKDGQRYTRTTRSLQRWEFNMNDIGAPDKETLRREGRPLFHNHVEQMFVWNGQTFYITQKGAVHYFLYQ
jgi:hypothetical protein